VRVLIAHPGAHFSVADVYNGLVKGLRPNGCTVATFYLADRMEFYTRAYVKGDDEQLTKAFDEEDACAMAAVGLGDALYRFWPDVVVIVSGFFIPHHMWGVLNRRPHHVVYWCTESPYEDDRQGRAARYVDTVVLNDPVNLNSFRDQINPRSFYFPHSYDPEIHHPGEPRKELQCDFGFVGTGFPSRVEFFEQVNWSGIDALFGGNWRGVEYGSPLMPLLIHDRLECMDNTDTADLYRSARVSANIYRKEHSDQADAAGWAMGPREVELAACGTFFLREPRGEGDDLFPHLPTFETPAEFEEQLRWALDHPEFCTSAATAARAAIADRTFQNTAARLLRTVESAGAKRVA
jgi:spore maturation protein CgeB